MIWNFSFSDNDPNTARGTLITNDLDVDHYLITGITGTFNGETITGLLPPGTWGGNDNVLWASTPVLDFDGVSFTTDGPSDEVNLFYGHGYASWVSSTLTDGYDGGFDITPVPEPASAGLLGAAFIALGLCRRRRRAVPVIRRLSSAA